MDFARRSRFRGGTWTTPPRGLSISAIRKNDTEAVIGTTRRSGELYRFAPKPSVKLAPKPTMTMSHHAGIGILSSHAATVASVELNTSFRPEATSAETGVGWVAAKARAEPQRSAKVLVLSVSISTNLP